MNNTTNTTNTTFDNTINHMTDVKIPDNNGCKITLDQIIKSIHDEQEQYKLSVLTDKLKEFNITEDKVKSIYDACISVRQSFITRNGTSLEDCVAKYLDVNEIHYHRQVVINQDGLITGRTKTEHIVDFVITPTKVDSLINCDIRDFIVLSIKNSVRERWAQDNWAMRIVPRKYILLTCANDYPSSSKFKESPYRKIITSKPKKNDDRIYKLSFDDIARELTYSVTFVDLFCGIGSFHYSFKDFECVMACDINQAAKNTYYANHGIMPMGDITTIDEKTLPRCDIICSGNPCQSFSNIGQRQGFKDSRGNLFYDVIRFATYQRPYFILFENVEGLAKHENGLTLTTMQEEIKRIGYDSQHIILKCSDYGIPQMRKRIFILCAKQELNIDLNKMLQFDYVETASLSKYIKQDLIKPIAYTIRCGGRRSPINDKHNWDGYYTTDHKEYRLTINDCLLLQGYDPNFKLIGTETEQFQLLGNTIPTNLTKLFYDKFVNYFINDASIYLRDAIKSAK